MKRRHKRIGIIVVGLAGLAVAAFLVLSAFQNNLVFFFSPTQVAAKEAPIDRTFRSFALSTMLLAVPLGAALAQDGAAVAERMKASLAAQGVTLGWSEVTGDASSMVLRGVSLKPAGDQPGLEIGDVTLTGVSE